MYRETDRQSACLCLPACLTVSLSATDFIVFYPDPNSYAATTIDYSTDERSWFDLYGTSPIRNVQLTFLWVSYTGNTYPLYLSKGDAIPLKLQFKARDDI